MTVRVRIAPSPTGNCHVGTARTALFNLLFARQHGGKMLLRIDDTDRRRSTEESERGVLEGLQWLGLTWDEGPYRQSERLDIYREHANRLVAAGHAYHCYCTEEALARERSEQLAAGLPPKYSGRCRSREAAVPGVEPVIRLRVPDEGASFDDLIRGPIAVAPGVVGDFVIMKSDGMPTYNFATVIDEHLLAITHVLRGNEHISNTFPQLYVYRALGWEPPRFGHLNLQLNADRSKISKRRDAVYVGQFRELGYLPEALLNFLALQGWSPGDNRELFTFDELVAAFSVERCTQANAVFDMAKLDWLNGQHLRRMPLAELAQRVAPFVPGAAPDRLAAAVALVQERLVRLDEAPALLDFFFADPGLPAEPVDGAVCAAAAERLATVETWTPPAIEAALRGLAAATGMKPGELFMPVRLAISGRRVTPPIFETLYVLGKTETLARLRRG